MTVTMERWETILKKMPEQDRLALIQKATPRINERYFPHVPHPKQQAFLLIPDKEAMYGGAAGGGKSDALLMAALQYVDIPGYSALLLRRTWPDLSLPGAIMDRARTWLEGTDAVPREGGRTWVFPSGARITFGYLQHEKDKYRYQSAEFQFVGFDELTQFTESTYTYMFSRVRRPQINCLACGDPIRNYARSGWKHLKHRTTCPRAVPDHVALKEYGPAADGMTLFDVPLRVRSATNPGGSGHVWVRDRFIDERTREKRSVFIPAKLDDNPSLDRESYRENLSFLSIVDRQRLLDGDWNVEAEGTLFQRHWFGNVDVVPAGETVRFWDMASTKDGGDWTVGAKVTRHDGRIYIADIQRMQGSPLDIEKLIKRTALDDGPSVRIRMEQEPGSSGVIVVDNYRRNVLFGFDFDGVRSSGSKMDRASPVSSQAEAGNVFLLYAPWNRDMLDEFVLFGPDCVHDDQVDAVSGAVAELAFGSSFTLIV